MISDCNGRPMGGGPGDDVYLRLQHGKGFHNLVFMSYVKYINPASKHNNSKRLCNNLIINKRRLTCNTYYANH
jgi:hypothetical protein